MVSVGSVARRVARGEFAYAIGRFRTARRLYSLWKARWQPVLDRGVRPQSTLFPAANPDQLLARLNSRGVAGPIQLPEQILRTIARHASNAPLRSHGTTVEGFSYSDVVSGRWRRTPIVIADLRNPLSSPAISDVCADPLIRTVVAEYLGYEPSHVLPWVFWSFAGEFTLAERRAAGQTFEYHYDVHGYNFVYVNFYLTDVDLRSGPHRIIPGSHVRKPFHLLFNSAIASDDAIERTYGSDAAETLKGSAGTGFFEDASCFHLAIPPTRRDRLMFQIRFS